MALFMHHADEEKLAVVFGSEALIPQRLRELYSRAHKLWCGPFGSSGGEIPTPIILMLIMLNESESTGQVRMTPSTQQERIDAEDEAAPPLGAVHSPILDLPVNTPVRANGKLGYFVGAWGGEFARVRLDGDDKPYRRFPVQEVELAIGN